MARSQVQSDTLETRPQAGDGLDLTGLDRLLGFHVRMAHVAMYRAFIAVMKDVDLTQKQAAVLTLIDQNPGCSQIALAGVLGTDRATMMAIVDRLQDRALLYRTRSTVDRRRQELYLTDQGREVLDTARDLIGRHEAQFTDKFTPAELATLRALLARIENG